MRTTRKVLLNPMQARRPQELAVRVQQLESELASAEYRAEQRLKAMRAFVRLALSCDAHGELRAALRQVTAKPDEAQP